MEEGRQALEEELSGFHARARNHAEEMTMMKEELKAKKEQQQMHAQKYTKQLEQQQSKLQGQAANHLAGHLAITTTQHEREVVEWQARLRSAEEQGRQAKE